MQVNWGRNKESHFRASAVFRDMYLHNESTGNNTSLFGWESRPRKYQSSGSPATLLQRCVRRGHHSLHPRFIGHRTGFYTQSSQSEEYSDYADVRLAGGCANRPRSDKLAISGGYSMAEVCRRNGAYADDEYRRGQYVFGNISGIWPPAVSLRPNTCTAPAKIWTE